MTLKEFFEILDDDLDSMIEISELSEDGEEVCANFFDTLSDVENAIKNNYDNMKSYLTYKVVKIYFHCGKKIDYDCYDSPIYSYVGHIAVSIRR